jgi:hypothetical protein
MTNDLKKIFRLDTNDSVDGVIRALFLEPFIAGAEPWARAVNLTALRKDATLLPKAVEPVRSAINGKQTTLLARAQGWSLLAVKTGVDYGHVAVTATSLDLAKEILSQATVDATRRKVSDGKVEVGFWHMAGRGPIRSARRLQAAPWEQIRRNYTASTFPDLDALMSRKAGEGKGRLLLLYGPPGTGKTTLIRALAHAWRAWCHVDYVVDPETLFRDPGYLLDTAFLEAPAEHRRLLVLEDCDELIRPEAKGGTGQRLSRLLNLTDGLLGQGLPLMVAITTNEPLSKLHPAIVRPGRCLAQIEVGRLTPAEARAWLGRSVWLPAEGITLAEAIALKNGTDLGEISLPAVGVGQYL